MMQIDLQPFINNVRQSLRDHAVEADRGMYSMILTDIPLKNVLDRRPFI